MGEAFEEIETFKDESTKKKHLSMVVMDYIYFLSEIRISLVPRTAYQNIEPKEIHFSFSILFQNKLVFCIIFLV